MKAHQAQPSEFALAVLSVVERIPLGRVLTYGDVAQVLGTRSARAVGTVMSRWGHEVAWQRVVLASGDPAPGHEREALRLLRSEGCPLITGGRRVDLARARWHGS